MRAIHRACAALLCAAAPAMAQPAPTADPGAPPPSPAAEPPASPASDADDEPQLAGEVIEITGEAPIVVAAPPPAEVEREEVRALAGARGDAMEAVRNLPGVAFASSYDGSAGDLIVRGTSGTDSWYLIDGVAIPAAMHQGNLTSVVPVEMIDSIELSPGGFDVSEGRATGGIVQIRSRWPRIDRWNGVADVSFVHASAFVQGPLWKDQLGVALSFRRSFIDALLPVVLPDDAPLSFTSPPRYSDAQLRLAWSPSARHEVSVLGLLSDDVLALDLDAENPNDPTFTGNIGARDRFWRVIGSWRYRDGGVQARATLAYGVDRDELDLNDTHFLDVRAGDVTARAELGAQASSWLKLRGGADVHAVTADLAARLPATGGEGTPEPNLTIDPAFEVDDTFTDIESAGYVAADIRAGRVAITPGVRVDHYSHIDDVVVQPRLSSEAELGGWTARGSVGRFSRPHSLAEAIPTDLEAETAIQATAGVERRFGDALRAQVTLFHTWLDDLVVLDPTRMAEDPLDGYASQGAGTARGVEVMVRVRRGDLFGWLAYTYSRSRRVDGPGQGERLFDYDQPHNLVAAASWNFGPWRLGGRFRYASGTPDTPIVGSVYLADVDVYRPVYGPPNSDRLEASHQLDLRVDRRFELGAWRLSAYLDVSNVYANARVIGFAYDFDYSTREPLTDLPLLPSIGLRGEI